MKPSPFIGYDRIPRVAMLIVLICMIITIVCNIYNILTKNGDKPGNRSNDTGNNNYKIDRPVKNIFPARLGDPGKHIISFSINITAIRDKTIRTHCMHNIVYPGIRFILHPVVEIINDYITIKFSEGVENSEPVVMWLDRALKFVYWHDTTF